MSREFKPQNSANWPSKHQTKDEGDRPTPWAGVEEAMGAKKDGPKRPFKDMLGMTPPRDGPYSEAARSLFGLMPYIMKASKKSGRSV